MDLGENRLISSQSAETTATELKRHVESRLQKAGLRVERSVPIVDGSKRPEVEQHTSLSNQTRPSNLSGNYSVHAGDGLVLLDIDTDDPDDLPSWLSELPGTFAVNTVHDGLHLYYAVEDDTDISNTSASWGSIRYEGWLTVGPGSVVDHDTYQRCTDCGKTGRSRYAICKDEPIATLTGDHLHNLRKACSSNPGNCDTDRADVAVGERVTFPDENLATEAERFVCTEFTSKNTTDLAETDLMDFLRGGVGSYDLRRENEPHKIDQSAADHYTLELLYGAFLFRGDDTEDAKRCSRAMFKRYCLENPFDKTGTPRKWLRKGDGYLEEQIEAVVEEFEFGKWHRWRRRKYEDGFDRDEHRPWTDPSTDGKPSLITKDTVRAAVWILTEGVDPDMAARVYGLDFSTHTNCGEMCTPHTGDTSPFNSDRYPTAKEVGRLAAQLNRERKASYFEKTLKELHRETDEFARAVCHNRKNGQRHVYFFGDMEPPEDADVVYCNGTEYDPASYPEGS